MPLTIAVSNHKGGVAKTTTCLSLGACLAEQGQRVLLVDLDPQADLTLAAGLDAESLGWSVADLLDPRGYAGLEPDLVVQPTRTAGLDLLPSDLRLAGVERGLYDVADYEHALAHLLAGWCGDYTYILVDCPPSLGALTLLALTAAQRVIIPVQCEYLAAHRLTNLLQAVSMIRERTNPQLDYFLLATMFDQRNRISVGVLEQLQANFPDHLLATVIGVDTRLRESPAVGEPITRYAPRTRATLQYQELARELHDRLRVEERREG